MVQVRVNRSADWEMKWMEIGVSEKELKSKKKKGRRRRRIEQEFESKNSERKGK